MNVRTSAVPSEAVAKRAAEAARLTGEALQLSNQGDNAGAERLYMRSLELKEAIFGPTSIDAALTLNALGEVQSCLSKIEEAEANLRRAVDIRNASGDPFDAAVSRENLAQVFEIKGEFITAKEMRDQGRPHRIACGNFKCPGRLFSDSQMKQCSRCHCVYYCSEACQNRDWRSRHRRLCRETTL